MASRPSTRPAKTASGGVAVGHGDRDQVAALAFGKPDHRGPVVGADDLIDLPAARHRALVDRGGPLGDVRPAGPRPGVSPLRAAAPPAAAAQTLRGFHVQRTAVERLVDGLCAWAPGDAVGGEVRPDRLGGAPQAQLVGDPFPQRPGRPQAAAPRPATLALGAALRRRRPVAATTAAARHLTGHRRRRSVHPPGDSRPTCLRILDQRAVDLLAFVQLQRCAWHAGTSIGRCLCWHRSS